MMSALVTVTSALPPATPSSAACCSGSTPRSSTATLKYLSAVRATSKKELPAPVRRRRPSRSSGVSSKVTVAATRTTAVLVCFALTSATKSDWK